MEFKQFLVVGALSVSMLTGCGSDSNDSPSYGATYTGLTSAGEINADTKDTYEETAIEAVKGSYNAMEALEELPTDLPLGVSLSGSGSIDKEKLIELINIIKNIDVSTGNLPVGAQIVEQGTCEGINGTLKMSTSDFTQAQIESDEPPAVMPDSYSITFTFNNYCNMYESDIIMNGSATLYLSTNNLQDTSKVTFNNLSIKYIDGEIPFTMTWNGYFEEKENNNDAGYQTTAKITVKSFNQSVSVGFSEQCDANSDCINLYDFNGSNGLTYRLELNDLEEEVRVYNPSLGYVYIEAMNPVTCEGEGGEFELDAGTFFALSDEAGTVLYIQATDCGVYENVIETQEQAQELM